MSANSKRRKRIGKVLVLLLASGSLLGISPLTAVADEPPMPVAVEIDVSVQGTPPPPECTPDPGPATWLPATSTITDTYNLDEGPLPSTANFAVPLGFIAGIDRQLCDGSPSYPPTGVVVANFYPDMTNGLTLDSMTCQPLEGCEANTLSVGPNAITGAYNVPRTIGNYGALINLSWTP
jgi:hypothetical protein